MEHLDKHVRIFEYWLHVSIFIDQLHALFCMPWRKLLGISHRALSIDGRICQKHSFWNSIARVEWLWRQWFLKAKVLEAVRQSHQLSRSIFTRHDAQQNNDGGDARAESIRNNHLAKLHWHFWVARWHRRYTTDHWPRRWTPIAIFLSKIPQSRDCIVPLCFEEVQSWNWEIITKGELWRDV